MTEAEWLACTDHRPMLEFLRDRSARKLRLFTCGSNRRIWERLINESRSLVDMAEQFADGLVERRRLSAAKGRQTKGSLAAASGMQLMVDMPVREVAHKDAWSGAYRFACVFNPADAKKHIGLLSDIFGNPFRPVTVDPVWLTPTVVSLATAIYDERAFDRLPILADALEDAGCTSADMLKHCRQPGVHVRGCWVIDLLTGRI